MYGMVLLGNCSKSVNDCPVEEGVGLCFPSGEDQTAELGERTGQQFEDQSPHWGGQWALLI